jgi:primary-amine oxidase
MSPLRVVPVVLAVALSAGAARGQDKALSGGGPVRWEGWAFNWKIHLRQGVVLTDVKFQGKSVLKYAAVAEVFVPYHPGQPRPQDQRDHPFGQNMVPLQPGRDCLPGGTCQGYDFQGKSVTADAAVMLHEEEGAPIYIGAEGRARAKTLTLWSAYTLGGYYYIVQWRFREDGVILPQVGLTGALVHFGGDNSNSVAVGAKDRALSHVHNVFFCLDFDVDGKTNTVEEFDYKVIDDEGEKATGTWTPIAKEGGRELKPEAFRSWRVVNNASKNRHGNPRSYELVPGGTGIYRGSKKETFARSDVWVTKFKPGEVPGPKLLADSLASYADGEGVDGADVVLWYMLSVHHQPKAEDWSAMPVEWCGFKIAPRDFLDGSWVKVNQASGGR